jgi:hypothetical protein
MPRQRALLFTKSKFTIIMSVSRYPSGFFPAPRRADLITAAAASVMQPTDAAAAFKTKQKRWRSKIVDGDFQFFPEKKTCLCIINYGRIFSRPRRRTMATPQSFPQITQSVRRTPNAFRFFF